MKYLRALLLSCCSFSTLAQSPHDSTDLSAFMDGLMEAQLKHQHIAGATLAVVHNGKILLLKGYGFSNLERQEPVVGESTLFRIGSISKMFVWTAIMQLTSEGKVSPEEDVNTYLGEPLVPLRNGKVITLKHLMTHTAGFEDHLIGLFARDSSSLRPLQEILDDEMPTRVEDPFVHASYSNHGTGIASRIVEKVSRLSFRDYVQMKILDSLGMNSTSFLQPLPQALRKMLSAGYQYLDGRFQERDFEYVPLYPVGSATTSARDMTHLMTAFLEKGTFKNYRLLDSATLDLMERPAHRHHASVNPMRLGFMDLSQNGVTVIGHGGDTFWFHSLMALLPEHHLGLFISFNSDQGRYLDVLEAFMDRYFPDSTRLEEPIKTGQKWLQRFAGEYRANRYSRDDLTKISSLSGRINVSVAGDSRIVVSMGEESKVFVPIDSTNVS